MPSWRQTTLTVKQLLDEQGAKRNDWGEPEPAVRCKCVARREQSTIRAPLPPCCLSYCQRNAAPVSPHVYERTAESASPVLQHLGRLPRQFLGCVALKVGFAKRDFETTTERFPAGEA